MTIRWSLAHEGIAGNERADTSAKFATKEPERHGVELYRDSDRDGCV